MFVDWQHMTFTKMNGRSFSLGPSKEQLKLGVKWVPLKVIFFSDSREGGLPFNLKVFYFSFYMYLGIPLGAPRHPCWYWHLQSSRCWAFMVEVIFITNSFVSRRCQEASQCGTWKTWEGTKSQGCCQVKRKFLVVGFICVSFLWFVVNVHSWVPRMGFILIFLWLQATS